jgi:hypothetical protein
MNDQPLSTAGGTHIDIYQGVPALDVAPLCADTPPLGPPERVENNFGSRKKPAKAEAQPHAQRLLRVLVPVKTADPMETEWLRNKVEELRQEAELNGETPDLLAEIERCQLALGMKPWTKPTILSDEAKEAAA